MITRWNLFEVRSCQVPINLTGVAASDRYFLMKRSLGVCKGHSNRTALLVLVSLFTFLMFNQSLRLTPDNEPEYMKIITRLLGQFDFKRWCAAVPRA